MNHYEKLGDWKESFDNISVLFTGMFITSPTAEESDGLVVDYTL